LFRDAGITLRFILQTPLQGGPHTESIMMHYVAHPETILNRLQEGLSHHLLPFPTDCVEHSHEVPVRPTAYVIVPLIGSMAHFYPEDIMVNFDVKSLFACVLKEEMKQLDQQMSTGS
jgi:hypothetical protein